ncbi:7187_t:CDS:1, partial [Gigaspora rosea]
MDTQKLSKSLILFGKKKELNLSCLAFANNTIFIASTQSNLQDILDKSNKFNCINDIDINPKKIRVGCSKFEGDAKATNSKIRKRKSRDQSIRSRESSSFSQ